jgi:hypothetical protein
MFELLRFSGGGAASGTAAPLANLEDAIRVARDLIRSEDPLSLVEVRDDGVTVLTVGSGWTSRGLSEQN